MIMGRNCFVTVDDEESIRKIYAKVVKNFYQECDVLEASDGEKGYALLEKLSSEDSKVFLLTDHGMPNLTGLEMIRKAKDGGLIKKMGENLKIYMLFSSSKDYGEEIGEKAVNFGAEVYFLKPVSLRKIMELVKDYFV